MLYQAEQPAQRSTKARTADVLYTSYQRNYKPINPDIPLSAHEPMHEPIHEPILRNRTKARAKDSRIRPGLPRPQPVSGLGGAEAGVIRAKDGQTLLRRSRLRISYSCTIA
jgi:hypothetical protein